MLCFSFILFPNSDIFDILALLMNINHRIFNIFFRTRVLLFIAIKSFAFIYRTISTSQTHQRPIAIESHSSALDHDAQGTANFFVEQHVRGPYADLPLVKFPSPAYSRNPALRSIAGN